MRRTPASPQRVVVLLQVVEVGADAPVQDATQVAQRHEAGVEQLAAVALHDARKTRPWNKFHELSKQRLADIHIESPRASIPGNYTEMRNQVSNRHQIKSAPRPRQYWLLNESNRIYPDTTDVRDILNARTFI